MICPKCGLYNADGAAYCNNCGSVLPGANFTQPHNFQYMPPQGMYYPPPQKSNKGLVIGIVAGVVLFLAVLFTVLYFTVFRYMLPFGGMEDSAYSPEEEAAVNTPGEEVLDYGNAPGQTGRSDTGAQSLVGQWYQEQENNLVILRDDGTITQQNEFIMLEGTYSYNSANNTGDISLYNPFSDGYVNGQLSFDNGQLYIDYFGYFAKISDDPYADAGLSFYGILGQWYQSGGAEVWLYFYDDGSVDITSGHGDTTHMATYNFDEAANTGEITLYETEEIVLQDGVLFYDGLEFIREYTGPIIADN